MSNAGSLWQKYHEFAIQIRQLDNRYLAYHVGTGQTHLLNDDAYNILLYLNEASIAKSVNEILTDLEEYLPRHGNNDLDVLLNALLDLSLVSKLEFYPDQSNA